MITKCSTPACTTNAIVSMRGGVVRQRGLVVFGDSENNSSLEFRFQIEVNLFFVCTAYVCYTKDQDQDLQA